MPFHVSCKCGRRLSASASDAGAQLRCGCGDTVLVPALSELRKSADTEVNSGSPTGSSHNVILIATYFVTMLGFVIFLRVISAHAAVLGGLAMFLAARFWLAIQVLREMSVPNALVVFVVPFAQTIFTFKRFDIAWRPFTMGCAGLASLVLGLTS